MSTFGGAQQKKITVGVGRVKQVALLIARKASGVGEGVGEGVLTALGGAIGGGPRPGSMGQRRLKAETWRGQVRERDRERDRDRQNRQTDRQIIQLSEIITLHNWV
jgi:hypothetical protein